MRSELNEFVTRYLSVVAAAFMVVGFVAFVSTAYDEDRASGKVQPQVPAIASASSEG
ncbi:MAG: hypothetical protein Fur007_01420 [Rhodoferax sp.]